MPTSAHLHSLPLAIRPRPFINLPLLSTQTSNATFTPLIVTPLLLCTFLLHLSLSSRSPFPSVATTIQLPYFSPLFTSLFHPTHLFASPWQRRRGTRTLHIPTIAITTPPNLLPNHLLPTKLTTMFPFPSLTALHQRPVAPLPINPPHLPRNHPRRTSRAPPMSSPVLRSPMSTSPNR